MRLLNFANASRCLICFIFTVSLSTNTYAQNEEIDSATKVNTFLKKPWYNFILGETFDIKSAYRRVSFSVPEHQLNNPNGFDVPRAVFSDGTGSGNETQEFLANISIENRWLQHGVIKRVWELHYDTVDYTGLDLKSLMIGTGISASRVPKIANGGRIGFGVSAGLTQSESFFDSATHTAVGVWAKIGIQVNVFFLEMHFRERKSFGQTLDNRTASPRVSVKGLSLGVIF